jgi:beta-galactosidase
MAEESANGINLYESYLRLKALEKTRPVLYIEAGGEWNSD